MAPDVEPGGLHETEVMPRYILEHRHTPRECGVVFASFNAFESPLRHAGALFVQLRNPPDLVGARSRDRGRALAQLPRYVAERTTATRIGTSMP